MHAVSSDFDIDVLPVVAVSENATKIAQLRYTIKFDDGTAESIEQWLWRVASAMSDDATMARKLYGYFADGEFFCNTPTMINAGRGDGNQMLHACFVLPVLDNMEGIFETLKHTALIHKTGGGTGFDFSALRQAGAHVRSTSGVASGPISFLSVFNHATEQVKQGGARRGANMGILSVYHPDILDFIACKQVSDEAIENFNISVRVDAAWLDKLSRDEDYELVDPSTGAVVGTLNTREVFDIITESAWRNGDPGLIFDAGMNSPRTNPTRSLHGDITATNPCGEQPLQAYEACVLGSINLGKFVGDSHPENFDWERLAELVRFAVRVLDNAVERCDYPIPEIANMVRDGNRKIGLGVMGWADALIALGIPYESDQALRLGKRVMSFIQEEADTASEELALERGNFPNWEHSVYGPGGELSDGRSEGRPMRNATRTTIAPTGTISIFAGCSGGIEPLYALTIERNQAGFAHIETNSVFVETARREGWWTDELAEHMRTTGNAHHPDVPAHWQAVFATTHDISPEGHVQMQAAFQRFTDNAVSKTVNFANHATVEDVRRVYELAIKLGVTGITVYRDGSKQSKNQAQVLRAGSSSDPQSAPASSASESVSSGPRPLPSDDMDARRMRIVTPHGTMTLFVSFDAEGRVFDTFLVIGKAGSDITSMAEAIGRLVSLLLRRGTPLVEVVEQLRGIGGRESVGFGPNRVSSVPDALAKALERLLTGVEVVAIEEAQLPSDATLEALVAERTVLDIKQTDLCPECGAAALEIGEGCMKCHSCGFSKC